MTIEKLKNGGGKWADTGTKAAVPGDLSLAKIAEGWVSGENADRPYVEFLNYLQNRADDRIDRILTERVTTTYEDSTDIYQGIVEGRWSESYGLTQDTVNTMILTTPAGVEIVDTCAWYNSTGDPRLLVLDAATPDITIVDPRDMSEVVTTNALTDDLPSGSGQTWEAISMCVDQTLGYVFVTFTDTNPVPDTHQVQAWIIAEDSADWVPAWASYATGQALTGTGNGSVGTRRDSKIIVADGTYVAISCAWVACASSASACIQMYNKSTGVAATPGAGDCDSGADFKPSEGIASDGTNIFFLAADLVAAPDETDICTATIADLTAGSGGAGYPFQLTGASCVGGLICSLGESMPVVAVHNTVGSWTNATDTPITVHDSSNSNLMAVQIGDFPGGEEGEDYFMNQVLDVKYDGVNVWFLAQGKDIEGANEIYLRLIKLDASKLHLHSTDQGENLFLTDLTNSIFSIFQDGEFPVGADNTRRFVNITHDGRDVWVNPEPRASQTYSGRLYRLPLATLRS